MFDAYSVTSVASRLPSDVQIQSIAASRQDGQPLTLFSGTKTGMLLTYKREATQRQFEVQMCRSFAKRPVTQLEFVPEFRLLFSLSDGIVQVHDASQSNYATKYALSRVKGVQLFSTHINNTGDLLVCVAVRRRIQLYRWNGTELDDDTSGALGGLGTAVFPDSISSMLWCADISLAIALRDEYFYVSLGKENDVQPLFTTGGRTPLMLAVDSVIGLARDRKMLFVPFEFDGKLAPDYPEVTWEEAPMELVYDSPLLLALVAGGTAIEVRSVRPAQMVQRIALPKASYLCRGVSGCVFVSATNDLWCLSWEQGLKQNVQLLVKQKQYELAIQLAEKADWSTTKEDEQGLEGSGRRRRLDEIKHLHAFHLFTQRRFEDAFRLYSEIQADVIYVVGLFSDLLPDSMRDSIAYPMRPPVDFTPDERRQGLAALAKFLVEKRNRICRQLSQLGRTEETEAATHRGLLQIVDTMLLKCYCETNDMLISSLLRLENNSCNLVEAEKLLLSKDKFAELFVLYERKQLHDKALEMLRNQANNKSTRINSIERTVTYLQNLGNEHLALILKYASWVLKENVEEGLKIFTEDTDQCRELDRREVVAFLGRECEAKTTLVYLEHVIFQWADEEPRLHDLLAEMYLQRVNNLYRQFLKHLQTTGGTVPRAGKEPGELGAIRTKLLYFLGFSVHYGPELLLVQLPNDALWEERAVLLGRLGRHEAALAVYTAILHDWAAAERHCIHYYSAPSSKSVSEGGNDSEDLFLILLRMYARPPDVQTLLGLGLSGQPSPQPNQELAMTVLKRYAHRINTVKSMDFLSNSVRLNDLWLPLEAVLQQSANQRRKVDLYKGLFYATKLRADCERMAIEATKVQITQHSSCRHCLKKIGNSAFTRFPDGTLMHYYCHKQSNRT